MHSVTDVVFNHSQIELVFHGLDTIANITLNNYDLLPSPNNMFVRYRYNVRDKLKTVDISEHRIVWCNNYHIHETYLNELFTDR